MRHARLQKLQRLRREWPFYVFLFYGYDFVKVCFADELLSLTTQLTLADLLNNSG